MNKKGQALIETAVFFLALSVLLAGLCGFTKWMAVRLKLLTAAKQGAFMYSSGHMQKQEVEQRMRQFLTTGSPALSAQGINVSIHSLDGVTNHFFEFDESVAQYTRPGGWYRLLGADPVITEKCVVKHAAHYWAPVQPWGGPAVAYAE